METTVITRIWHGRTKAEHAEVYLRYVVDTGVADYKSDPGNLSVWRQIDGAICHFWTVTKWDSLDSIKQFAGEDYEKAKYYPGGRNLSSRVRTKGPSL